MHYSTQGAKYITAGGSPVKVTGQKFGAKIELAGQTQIIQLTPKNVTKSLTVISN